MTKEKFKTKATETFSKVIKGAKKGVLKAGSGLSGLGFAWGSCSVQSRWPQPVYKSSVIPRSWG